MTGRIRIFVLAMAVVAMLAGAAAADAAKETAAREAYDQLMGEIQKGRNTTPMDQLITKAEEGLKGIVETYPGTAASGSAMVMLGQIYSQTRRSVEAKEVLDKYNAGTFPKEPGEEGMAWMSVANAYLAEDDFAGAEKALKKGLAVEGLDPQMKQSAEGMLARLETMKKLKTVAESIALSVG